MVEVLRDEGNFVALRLSGKLTDADYKQFTPLIGQALEKGKLHLLVEMKDFHGWESAALWDDIKLDTRIGGQIERLALVGENTWQEWMANICRPFTRGEVQYFSTNQTQDAWAWVQDGL